MATQKNGAGPCKWCPGAIRDPWVPRAVGQVGSHSKSGPSGYIKTKGSCPHGMGQLPDTFPYRACVLENFPTGKMEGPFNGGIPIAVRTVDGILPNTGGIKFPYGPLSGIGRIGGPDQGTEILDGIILFQDGRNDRPAGHKIHQFPKKGTFLVDRIEFLGIPPTDLGVLHGHDLKALSRYLIQAGLDVPTFNGIRFYHGKCSVCNHSSKFCAKIRFLGEPTSFGWPLWALGGLRNPRP